MEVSLEGLFAEDPDRPQAQVLRGRVVTADMEEKALVEKVLEAEQDGKAAARRVEPRPGRADPLFHGQGRRPQGGGLGGRPVLGRRPDPDRQPRPARPSTSRPSGAFEVVSVEPVVGETRHVLVRFSDSLARDQNLQGLIRVENRPLTFEIDGNVVRVYSTQEFLGTSPSVSCPASATTSTAG